MTTIAAATEIAMIAPLERPVSSEVSLMRSLTSLLMSRTCCQGGPPTITARAEESWTSFGVGTAVAEEMRRAKVKRRKKVNERMFFER